MLNDLTSTLAMLRKRIQVHRDYLEHYEERTRVSLIDPVLCALGWDVSDPGQVKIESEVADTKRRVDYSLLGAYGKPIVFLEAKKLSVKDHALVQVAAYVMEENDHNNTNVRYCIWTNGDSWVGWDIKKTPARIIEARIMDPSQSAAKIALKLVGLWRDSLVDTTYEPPSVLCKGEIQVAPPKTEETDTVNQKQAAGKLNASQRAALEADIKAGKLTQAQLAKRYSVAPGTIAYHKSKIKK